MKILFVASALLLASCAAAPVKPPVSIDSSQNSVDDQLISKGAELVAAGSTKQALDDYFSPVVNRCEKLAKNSSRKLYASRSSVETLYYMTLAATANIDAEALSPTCAQAFYFKGYASLDLGLPKDAMHSILKAVEWSPVNARYISELGHLYQLNQNWEKSLSTFREAEVNADIFSPVEYKNDELTRAKRGVGFNLIELGMLDEAEQKFEECLVLDKRDKRSLDEIKYIKALRKQQSPK